ncbi:MAG: hypothetical protein JWN14_4441 [Chthonomonadales bacterium]|nr:hypothetical protein [Chthonomonadales bacterium]
MISTASRLPLLMRSMAALLALCLFATLLPAGAQAQAVPPQSSRGFGSHGKQENLLYRVTFKTPQGEILLLLPADLRAGEQVSGTIHLLPKGKEEAQRAENRRVLGEYLLAIGTQRVAASEAVGHWTLPAEANLVVTLQQKQTQGAGSAATGLVLTPADTPPASPDKQPRKGGLPEKGQAGRPLALSGLADTDLLSRHILIGGKEAGFLAASPHLYIVESPADVFGKTTLQVRQGDTLVAEGLFRNERVRRSNNAWVFVILGALGIALAVTVASSLNHAKDVLSHLP